MSPSRSALAARIDVWGLGLGMALIGWTNLAAATTGTSAARFSALFLASIAALVLARLTASFRRSFVPLVVVGAATVLAVSTPDLLSSGPLSGPFGYANAKGGFYLQAAIAGLMVASAASGAWGRVLGLVASVAFGIVPVVVESLTPSFLLLAVAIAALASRSSIGSRTACIGLGLLVVVVLLVTIALGSSYAEQDRSSVVDQVVDSTLTERRAALWHEAFVLMREHPIAGVGLGRFRSFSPTARSDPDARWAHNSFLQHGAETGVMGLLLLAALFVFLFLRLGATTPPDTFTVLGAASLAVLGVQASVDYILHFPALPITAAALVGAAGSPAARKRTRS